MFTPSLPRPHRRWLVLASALTVAALVATAHSTEGLLFYLSGTKGATADFSATGSNEPTFNSLVSSVPDGARGAALRCEDTQRLAWLAPGNIYAQRGTLSFFWRARYPVGPTEFPIFRVAYADHSSWDMVWLRIDYNGHGFDAFVTDAGLARTRVSVALQPFPKPDEWIHLALAWDETRGIRFYINGRLAAAKETVAHYDAALDQFGPHSRIISPHNVQSDYQFVRGGDIDEIRIYDRMLSDENIAALSRFAEPGTLPEMPARSLDDVRTRAEWSRRYGWENSAPPYLADASTAVRKVEIHDAYDLKRWWWKATDGIRETTWPGVYNRSRLPGRNDYFQLPDWDCYSESGRAITFTLPDEPWNHLEIAGAAWGQMQLLAPDAANDAAPTTTLFERQRGADKTVHRLASAITGGKIRFENVEQEEPINELAAYNVTAGAAPVGSRQLAYRLSTSTPAAHSTLAPLQTFIAGRFASNERSAVVAVPADRYSPPSKIISAPALPLVHVLIPDDWDQLDDGLDGIVLELPALDVKPTQGDRFALNLQVKDPLWPLRDMLDFTFSVKPGEARTLWLDLRDRLLPPGKALYLTLAGGGGDFNAASLEGATVRLVFKPRAAARAEHELDRFTQARDSHAMLVEENPRSPKFNLWNRFAADLHDLLRVNPDHLPGRTYAAVAEGAPRPPLPVPEAPADVPRWAFLQTQLLQRVENFVLWYIDHRQLPDGEFGGGISDDTDLTNLWPGVALMGCAPEKITDSVHRLLEASFANGMWTNGLSTIQTDELHSYEEGINCLGQNLILDHGNPRQLERAMATARATEGLTGINRAGHRHLRTSYFSGTRQALEDPWGYAKAYNYLLLQPSQLLVEFNGSPAAKKMQLELADGLLAHRHRDADGDYVLPSAVHFSDDANASATRNTFPWPLFWTAWRWTGDRRYLQPIFDGDATFLLGLNANALDALRLRDDWGPKILAGTERVRKVDTRYREGRGNDRASNYRLSARDHFTWQLTGDRAVLERLYAARIQECDLLDYINTEGSLWIDRVGVPTAELQRARLGGIALIRGSGFPGHVVSWKFAAPAKAESVAILVPDATAQSFTVIGYNLEDAPVRASMTGWDIDPGTWEISQGIASDGGDEADRDIATFTAPLQRSGSVDLTFAPHATTVLKFKLKTPGTPYWQRPDLGISRDDVVVAGREIGVTIHSLGGVAAPPTTVALRDRTGRLVASAEVASLPPPVDLQPKTTEVHLTLPAGIDDAAGCTVELDPSHAVEEITELNNAVKL